MTEPSPHPVALWNETVERQAANLIVNTRHGEQRAISWLISKGCPDPLAREIVSRLLDRPEVRVTLEDKYYRRMKFGLYWIVGGAFLSILSIISPAREGSFIFIGAIAFGLWEYLTGKGHWQKYNSDHEELPDS